MVGPVASQLGHGTRIRVGGHHHITGRGRQDGVVTDLLVVDGTLDNFDRSRIIVVGNIKLDLQQQCSAVVGVKI